GHEFSFHMLPLIDRTYAVGFFAFGRAVLYLLLCFVLRSTSAKRNTDIRGGTLLPQAEAVSNASTA
ncbi:MAG TPA: hypothetical protein VKB96_08455, partial [Gammaproteobacteria bacterium]|nr:hypothetical protein [Gammaproteobacteria bacterium]